MLRSLAQELVPIQEEHEARLERGIFLERWDAMDIWEKALLIAVRRVRVAQANLQSEAEMRQSAHNASRAK